MSMGSLVANATQHECDACDGTYTGTWTELGALGWKRHTENGAVFVMCDACESEYAERRMVRAEARAKEADAS